LQKDVVELGLLVSIPWSRQAPNDLLLTNIHFNDLITGTYEEEPDFDKKLPPLMLSATQITLARDAKENLI